MNAPPPTIAFPCPGCGVTLTFAIQQAGTRGPCFRCGAPVTVPAPQLVVACSRCGTPSAFHPSQAGQTGPCRACGAVITVGAPAAPRPPSIPAPSIPAPPMRAPSVPPSPFGPAHPASVRPPPAPVALSAGQMTVLGDVQREAAKLGVRVAGSRAVRVGHEVSTTEALDEMLKARFLFGGTFRTDTVQAVQLVALDGSVFFLVIPWSGATMLAHELASLVPGALPASLWLTRGALGAWSSGRWMTSRAGEADPLAKAADDVLELNDGVAWDWESGRLRIKLGWGLQAVLVAPGVTLHVMHTAQHGIVFRDFGLGWYLERRLAFARFASQHGVQGGGVPPASWAEPPLTLLFRAEVLAPLAPR